MVSTTTYHYLLLLGWTAAARCFPLHFIASSRATNRKISSALSQTVLDKVASLYPILPEPTGYDEHITTVFPGALNNYELMTRVASVLAEQGYTDTNTLLATSLCGDELARRLEDDFVGIYGTHFNLGGLAGFPFTGQTGFTNLAQHVPDGGHCLLIYGPHVGVSFQHHGQVGIVERSGVEGAEPCCASAIQAATQTTGSTGFDFANLQQGAVEELLAPHLESIRAANDPNVELPHVLLRLQDELLQEIVQKGCRGLKNTIALLGGIQINTAPHTLDYFLPFRFVLVNTQGEVVQDLLPMTR